MKGMTPMNRIRRWSLVLKGVFLLVFVGTPIVQLVGWGLVFGHGDFANPDSPLQAALLPAAIRDALPPLPPVTLPIRLAALAASMLPAAMTMTMCAHLIRLFQAYARGELFTAANARHIKLAGLWLLLRQLADPLYGALLSALLTLNAPPGQRMISLGFGSLNLLGALAGAGILLVAWIMQEGCRLQDENALTI